MGGFGKKRDRIREIATDSLDQREAAEHRQSNEKPALADLTIMVMGSVPVVMVMSWMPVVIRVLMITVILVRVRHRPQISGLEDV